MCGEIAPFAPATVAQLSSDTLYTNIKQCPRKVQKKNVQKKKAAL
jgi:hypothetical protein